MTDAEFEERNRERIAGMATDDGLHKTALAFLSESVDHEYSYHFRWLGLPIIQYPQDIVAMQELIWSLQPDLIVETGIAHGGSLIFSASMLELNAACGGPAEAKVVGIDIDIRAHNRAAIEAHPMARHIQMIEGSSIDPDVVAQVRRRIEGRQRVLVVLDSMHTHAHVLEELRQYGPMVTNGSYLVVFDTCIEQLPEELYSNRPWQHGDNPWTAVQAFLGTTDRFVNDRSIPDKLQVTVAPDGYLRCVGD